MPKMRFAGTLSLVALAVSAMPAYAGFEWVSPSSTQAAPMVPNSVYVAPPPPRLTVDKSDSDIISPVIITGTSRPAKTLQLPAKSVPAPVLVTTAQPVASDAVPVSNASVAVPIVAPPSSPSSAPAPALVVVPDPVLSPEPSKMPAPFPVQSDNKPDLATETISTAPTPAATAAPTPILASAAVPASADGTVQGFASQIPLTLALRQLLPVGYSFALDQDVDSNTPVSFKGGKAWRETLADMLSPASLVFHESDHAIVIGRAAAPTPSLAPVLSSTSPTLSPLPAPVNVKPSYLSLPPSMQQQTANPVLVSGGDMRVASDWSAERGDTLRKVLGDWCKRSNTELQWLAEYDYPIEASAHFSGNFEDAVRNLLSGFDGARPQPIGELHTNQSAGQMVLVVQTRGNSYSN